MEESVETQTETQTSPRQLVQEEASHVAGSAREEVGHVVDEAKRQGRQLYVSAVDRAREEAQEQTHRAAGGLRTFSQDLRSMTDGEPNSESAAVSWMRQGADRIESLADHVDQKGLEGLIDDVSSYARRNPGTFLAIAFGAGVAAARIFRNVDGDEATDGSSQASERPMADAR
jgi:hypothetical protein